MFQRIWKKAVAGSPAAALIAGLVSCQIAPPIPPAAEPPTSLVLRLEIMGDVGFAPQNITHVFVVRVPGQSPSAKDLQQPASAVLRSDYHYANTAFFLNLEPGSYALIGYGIKRSQSRGTHRFFPAEDSRRATFAVKAEETNVAAIVEGETENQLDEPQIRHYGEAMFPDGVHRYSRNAGHVGAVFGGSDIVDGARITEVKTGEAELEDVRGDVRSSWAGTPWAPYAP